MATKSFEVLERFGFVDGTRLAWVRYVLVGGSARCVAAREIDSNGPIQQ